MRYLDGSLVGDLNDGLSAFTSQSVQPISGSSIDENQTEYDLFPLPLNQPPIITGNIVDSSTPTIKSIELTDGLGRDLFVNADRVVRVLLNSSFTLKFEAQQPNTLNVQNGIPTQLSGSQAISYVWKLNEQPIVSQNLGEGSSVVVNSNILTFVGIQPSYNGVFTCEASNDIGTVVSEPISIEVYDPAQDPLIYRNLVENPYGQDGTTGWNSNNSEFVTKELTTIPVRTLKTPNRVDVFGYRVDNFYPRPYQISNGAFQDVNYNSILSSKNATYFSRSSYKYFKAGGVEYVKAYQDIDLTDVVDLIRGGVYGVNGVRGVFGCYIGNAISNYKPVEELVLRDKRLNRRQYFLGAPRLSIENTLTAGPPQLIDKVYVTVEQYENETRLPNVILGANDEQIYVGGVITLLDPWNKRLSQASYQYYTEDVFNLGFVSGEGSRHEALLNVADQLLPSYQERYNYGQYVEFTKLVFDKLNPRTNKIRITLHYLCQDPRLTEDINSDLFDFTSWDRPHKRNTLGDTTGPNQPTLDQLINSNPPVGAGLRDVPNEEKYFVQPDPRPLVTGVTFGLIPILRPPQSQLFIEQSNLTLTQNQALPIPTSSADDVLVDIPFDPLQLNRRNIVVGFNHRSPFYSDSSIDELALVNRRNTMVVGTTIQSSSTGPFVQLPISNNSFLPFEFGQQIDMNSNAAITSSTDIALLRGYSAFVGAGVEVNVSTNAPEQLAEGQATQTINRFKANLTETIQGLDPSKYWAASHIVSTINPNFYQGSDFDEEGSFSNTQIWYKNARFIAYFQRRQTATEISPITSFLPDSAFLTSFENRNIPYNSYYVELDYSTGNSRVLFYRDQSLPGSGSLQPVEASHSFENGKLLIELPDEVLFNSQSEGGLEIPFTFYTQQFSPIQIALGQEPIERKIQSGDYATSLYLMQAAPYGVSQAPNSSLLSGTPQFGFVTGSEYYYIRYRGIYDQQIDNLVRN